MIQVNAAGKPAHVPHGLLALEYCSSRLPLIALRSAAGWYLGTCDEFGPVSRESAEYWSSEEQAKDALRSAEWTQRDHP